jgi:hypothetical protein
MCKCNPHALIMAGATEIKQCSGCGKEFECYSEGDCWCENYQVHRKEYLEIIRRYDDCLCPECLQNYAEK